MPWIVLAAAILQVVGSTLVTTEFFNSGDRFTSTDALFIQPAGYAFSIWGLIYFFAFIYAVYQVIPKYNNASLEKTRPLIASLFVLSVVWLWTASFSGVWLWLTVVVLFVMAGIAATATRNDETTKGLSQRERFFSLGLLYPYAAWVGVAQFVNLGAVLLSNWTISGTLLLAVNIIILLALCVYSFTQYRQRGYPFWYGFVLVWAAVGVIVANYGQGSDAILLASFVVTAAISFVFLQKSLIPNIKKKVAAITH